MSFAVQAGPGQADRACDLVAASIIEEFLRRDPEARVDVRVAGGHGVLFIAAEAQGTADFDVAASAKRALASIDAGLSLEPFVALEAMRPPYRSEPLTVIGYATSETPSFLPPSVDQARSLVRELERLRFSNPDWYWLAPDYEVSVTNKQAFVRVSHAVGQALEFVRDNVGQALTLKFSGDIHVNVAGTDARSGLTARIGSSGRPTFPYGAKLPSQSSGIGRELKHPDNLGRWLARAAARELVVAGCGKAVLVEIRYHPLEAKPAYIQARNEKGENLSNRLNRERFDLSAPPEGWNDPRLLVAEIRHTCDLAEALPWEI